MELKRWCQDWWWTLWAGNPRRLILQLGSPGKGERALDALLTRDDAAIHLLSVFETWRREDAESNDIERACTRAYCLAIEGLTKLKARQAVGAWIALLDDPDIAVRVKAIQALGEIGDPRARDPLIPFLGDLFDHAAVALRKLGETETVEIIERVLQRDASALERLRANGPPETAKLNALGRALGFRACAANAAWALDSLGEVWVIISALDEPDPTAVNAARELGNLGRVEGLPRLRSKSGLFRTTSAELKEVCCEAIAKLEKLAALPRSTSSPAASDLSSLPRPAAPKTVDPATLPRAAEP